MEEERHEQQIDAPEALTVLLGEFSAITDYRTLRDSLPRRLATLLKCRCVLLYQRIGETLQFVSGSFADQPGWSAELLAVAHINPISLTCAIPEAYAWRDRQTIYWPALQPTQVVIPLIYRHRVIGILTAYHAQANPTDQPATYWRPAEKTSLEAIGGVVALLLENTRLLERDRERIHELSLLNSISSQINCSLYELEYMRSIVLQRTREISNADVCALLMPTAPSDGITWITPQLHSLLFQRFQAYGSLAPLVIERPGNANDERAIAYLEQLPAHIKTFFALPLLNSQAAGNRSSSLLRGSIGTVQEEGQEPGVLGIIVGGYHHAWKLRREEEVLLQVLANQTSTVIENMVLVTQVIEARNEARKLLRQVLDDQRLKELILEGIPSGLITTDHQGRIITFNRAAEVILGYHPYEVLGQPLTKFLNLHTLQAALDNSPRVSTADALLRQIAGSGYNIAQARAMRGTTVITEDRHGHEIVLNVDILPLHDNLGEQIGILATFSDVTSIHRLEEEKRRLDRLATLGEMAANVAHEVRNPLASIKTSMQMLIDDLSSSESTTEQAESAIWAQTSVEVVLKEVERLDTIVRDLLLFARPRYLHRAKCDLQELCNRVLELLRAQCAAANIEVHRVFAESLPPLWVDIGQLEQILLNLFVNALQAMPDGGVLTITCRCSSPDHFNQDNKSSCTAQVRNSYSHVQEERRLSSEEGGVPPLQWIEIAVSDTGMGVPPEQVGRIFQPFFTTKAHGIGLGLAITRRLIEDHGGSIRVEGQFGYGATMIISLPIMEYNDEHDG